MNERLWQKIETQEISDTHEHIISSGELKKHRRGLIELLGEAYLHDDMISAGARDEMFSPEYGDEERWKMLCPYLDRVRNTTYYRCLIKALNDLFGTSIKEIDDSNWKELNELLYKAAESGRDWYEYVLHEKADIAYCMLDMDRTMDSEIGDWKEKGLPSIKDTVFEKEFFERVSRIDPLTHVVFDSARAELEEMYSVKIESVDSLDELMELFIRKSKESGAVSYKSVAAYFRTLDIEECKREKANKNLKNILQGTGCETEKLEVQNYMIHYLVRRAGEQGMPFQFHTGMQALNENTIRNSDPLKLNPLFLKYGDNRFTMLHGGYPFCREAGVVAKKFPNVYLDFSWLPQIGYAAAKQAAREWFDLVPMNKMTWGGDCRHVENSYSAVLLFRRLMYEVLSEKIKENYLSEEIAGQMVERIMYKNAVEIYALKGWAAGTE